MDQLLPCRAGCSRLLAALAKFRTGDAALRDVLDMIIVINDHRLVASDEQWFVYAGDPHGPRHEVAVYRLRQRTEKEHVLLLL